MCMFTYFGTGVLLQTCCTKMKVIRMLITFSGHGEVEDDHGTTKTCKNSLCMVEMT